MAEREWLQGQICFMERSEITSHLIAELERHWDSLRGDRPMPRRGEVDPIDLARWLPYISIMELHYDPFRVRYRVVGTEVARISGEDFSNRWLDETGWSAQAIELNRLLYVKVAETARPLYGLSTITFDGREDCVFEWVLLPLSNDNRTVTHCLSLDDMTSISPRSRLLPLDR
jgi:hypothetical protein